MADGLDEMALLDLPAQVDFVLRTSGQRQLGLVGHSQGGTLPLMLLAARPEYAAKLWLLALLSAVTRARMPSKRPSCARRWSAAARRCVARGRAGQRKAASGRPCGAGMGEAARPQGAAAGAPRAPCRGAHAYARSCLPTRASASSCTTA